MMTNTENTEALRTALGTRSHYVSLRISVDGSDPQWFNRFRTDPNGDVFAWSVSGLCWNAVKFSEGLKNKIRGAALDHTVATYLKAFAARG